MNVAKVIGVPALLEQCAEECSEFAQACLKMARKMRDENPTPKTKGELWENINEEAADVELCIESLLLSPVLSNTEMTHWKDIKRKRWDERLSNFKKEE